MRLIKDGYVYCSNCKHFNLLIKSVENDLDNPIFCEKCNPYDFEDSRRLSEKPNYVDKESII